MEHVAPAARVALPRTGPVACQLCGRQVEPDELGVLECTCGWGGPDDPLEAARGLSRIAQRADRRMANALARRHLRRLRAGVASRPVRQALYLVVLFVSASLIYAGILVTFIGSAFFTLLLASQRAWVGAALTGLVVLELCFAFYDARPRVRGVVIKAGQYPALAAALREVAACVGASVPHRIVLTPGTNFSVFHRYPLRHIFYPQLVLTIGVGALPLLTEQQVKSILAHELGHYRRSRTALHRYLAGAESLLRHVIQVAVDALNVQTRSTRRSRSTINAPIAFGTIIGWILTFPFVVLWQLFHLLRLGESRAAEFAADAAAVRAYGAESFIQGLTRVRVAQRTLFKNARHMHEEMRQHKEPSIYAEMRRHFAALPPDVIEHLRMTELRAFRSLEDTHPVTPDRLRAAHILDANVPAVVSAMPALALVVPAGEQTADVVEGRLTTLLFK